MDKIQSELEAFGPVTEAPLVIEDDAGYAWDQQADIVVIGFGAAGSCAAIEASDLGGDVLVVERFDGGGACAYSGGVVYAAGTPQQRDAGFEDSPEEMYKYLIAEGADAVVSKEKVREYCDQSAGNLEWLTKLGIGYEGSYHAGKATYPDEDKFLYYSGSESVPRYKALSKPAPRGHRTKGKGFTGKYLFKGLRTAVEARNIRVSSHSRAMRLIVGPDNAVLGVEILTLPDEARKAHQTTYTTIDPWRPFNYRRSLKAVAEARRIESECQAGRRSIRARKGVIIATGGFSYNFSMLRQHMPAVSDAFHALMPNASVGCDGSGIELGQSVGGSTAFMERRLLSRMLTPPASKAKGLIVNLHGQRFVNEDIYIANLGNAVAEQENAKAWLILDNQTYWEVVKEALPSKRGPVVFKNFGLPTLINFLFGGSRKSKTIAGLERKCGLPAGSLVRTVEALNSALAQGKGDPMGKSPDYTRKFGKGPYRAFNADLANITTFTGFFTLGGLRVDEESNAVLAKDGNRVQGLYAIGRAAVGVCSKDYFASGVSLQDCVFSGRRAARAAMSRNG